MSNIALFNASVETLPSKSRTLTSGASTCTYLSKKEYGEKFQLKGAELRKKHEQYRLDRGVQANGNLATMLTTGQIVAEKMTTRKDGSGFSIGFTYANQFESADPKAVASQLSDDELLAIIEKRKIAKEAAGQN